MTIKGITKSVVLDATYNNSAVDQRAKAYRIGFSATTEINRSDFDLGLYAPYVSDAVQISIEAELIKPL